MGLPDLSSHLVSGSLSYVSLFMNEKPPFVQAYQPPSAPASRRVPFSYSSCRHFGVGLSSYVQLSFCNHPSRPVLFYKDDNREHLRFGFPVRHFRAGQDFASVAYWSQDSLPVPFLFLWSMPEIATTDASVSSTYIPFSVGTPSTGARGFT